MVQRSLSAANIAPIVRSFEFKSSGGWIGCFRSARPLTILKLVSGFRQAEGEDGAVAGFALNVDGSAVGFDDGATRLRTGAAESDIHVTADCQ
jgi:hypothetical protein